MPRYKVVGTRTVAGRQPGEIIEEDELSNINIDALVTSGHLAIAKPSKKEKDSGQDCASEPSDHDQLG